MIVHRSNQRNCLKVVATDWTVLTDCIRLIVFINTMWCIGWFLWSDRINWCNLTCTCASRTNLRTCM
jgi:hypothetical protein